MFWSKLFRQQPKRTPLHDAAECGAASDVERLLRDGANPNARDEKGDTPLRLTCWRSTAQLLISAGADVNTANDAGLTVLHKAAYTWNPHLLPLYLAHGPGKGSGVAAKDGTTPLLTAAIFGHDCQVVLLLLAGAKANVRNDAGLWSVGHVKAQVVQRILAFFAALDRLALSDNESLLATTDVVRREAIVYLTAALTSAYVPPAVLDVPQLHGEALNRAVNDHEHTFAQLALPAGQHLWAALPHWCGSDDFSGRLKAEVRKL